jgi:magnesium transporter
MHHYHSLTGEYDRIANALENNIAILDELRKTNDSLLNTKMNDVMKTLTVMAFITFPLSLVGTLFGMNISAMPFVNSPYAFWIVLSIMLVVAFILMAFFKFKKWF